MRTYSPKPADIQREWHVIDATDVVLGRLAVQTANLLRGKHKPTFAPHVDMGDFVIIVNAEKVALSGNKKTTKMAYRHSGYPGGLSATPFGELLEKDARKAIEKAVWGMLPKNRSAARCSRSSRSTPARTTRTRPSRPRRSRSPRSPSNSADRETRVRNTVTETTETDRGRGDLRGRRAGRRLQLRERPVRRRPGRARRPSPPPRPPAVARRPSPACASSPAPASGPSTAARSTPTSRTSCTSRSSTSPSSSPQLEGRFDVIARIHGGGITGQAGALRLGVARCAQRRSTSRPTARR